MIGKELSRAARYRAGRALVGALARLPPALGRRVGAFVGWLGWCLVRRDRRLALANLAAAYPDLSEREVRQRARRVFQELGRNIFEVAAWPGYSAAARKRWLALEGGEHLRRALAEGRGAVLLAAHQGAWELIPVALAGAGFEVLAVARPMREPRLQKWLDAHRARLGIRTLPRGAVAGLRGARRVLERGALLGILFDHRVRRGGQMVEFFGRPARFVAGPVRLALRTGAPIVPVHVVRGTDGVHRVRVRPPVERPPAGTEAGAAVAEWVRRCVAELEGMIREEPEQWIWMHPRWDQTRWDRPRLEPSPRGEWGERGVKALVGKLLGVGALLCALGGVSGCTPEPKGAAPSRKPDDGGPEASTIGFTTRETVEGRRKWVLVADSARTWEERGQTLLSNLKVDFYDAEESIYSVLTADEGAVYRNTNNVTARGNVRIVTVAGDTLTTEQLAWENAVERVRTDDPFRLARPDGVIRGTGFESDPGLRNYTTKDVIIDARNDPNAGAPGSRVPR